MKSEIAEKHYTSKYLLQSKNYLSYKARQKQTQFKLLMHAPPSKHHNILLNKARNTIVNILTVI